MRLKITHFALFFVMVSTSFDLLAMPAGISVIASRSLNKPISGRLIVFARRVKPEDALSRSVDISAFQPTGAWVASREISGLAAGATILLDGEIDSFPTPFSALPAGMYDVQAVLDQNHDYNYGNRGAGDIVSKVARVEIGSSSDIPPLLLETVIPSPNDTIQLRNLSAEDRALYMVGLDKLELIDFVSPSLSKFWGRPIHMRGWIGLPPGYDPGKRETYPTVYTMDGFGSSSTSLKTTAASQVFRMAKGKTPRMIWIALDHATATGLHEFADSVNNGPWGLALTTELIPDLEKRYRMDSKPNGRFLTGHSSGGWATLWLQTRYPKMFGGTWSTSPDPSDFTDFNGVDLYAPGINMYRTSDGALRPLVRDKGKVVASIIDFTKIEGVLGVYGGQLASFEWSFSPRGPDGRPLPMFDRQTGAVDAEVVNYWRDNYDISYRLKRDWPVLRKDLDGKINVIVGTADTFYLDGAAHRLQATLDTLGAKSTFSYLPDKTHFDLYARGDDQNALARDIAWEMYAIARPEAVRPASSR